MSNGKRKVDIALVMKTKDENGKIMTRKGPDGRDIPDPMIVTRNYNVPDDVEIRFSLWDLDAEVLMPLMSGNPSQDEFETFFQLMHGRMQELAGSGDVKSMLDAHDQRRRIALLENQVRAAGQTPVTAND